MAGFIISALIGVICIILGVSNMKGNINSLHSYHRHRVSEEDRLPFGSLVTLAPEKIVYISCNPETQARDLSYLTRKGYKVRRIQPVDMFPHTEHVETVALLVRRVSSI